VPITSRARWWAFAPYVLVSIVHVTALAYSNDVLDAATKILLMPLLLGGVIVVGWGLPRAQSAPLGILVVGLFFSWLGDEASVFFSFAPELPVMLAMFGVAHLAYIWLFNRHLAIRRLPWWTLVYLAWWVAVLAVLWPNLGSLALAVAAYGIVLGGTAASSARCHPIIAIGGALFLCSDTILAFRLFTDGMPQWTSPMVMVTYCAGQGLIAAGTLVALRLRAAAPLTPALATT